MKTYLLWILSIVAGTVLQITVNAAQRLTITPNSGNIVLSWQSIEGQTFLVRFRTTLDASSSWQTLTDGFPAAIGTNMTTFVHSNQVSATATFSVNTNTDLGGPPSLGMSTDAMEGTFAIDVADGGDTPPAMPPMPPSFSGMTQLSGGMHAMTQSGDIASPDDLSPDDTSTNTASDPNCGFYELVKDGIQLYNITNGMVLSGTIPITFEYNSPANTNFLMQLFLAGADNEAGLPGTLFNGTSGCWDTTQVTNGTYTIQLGVYLNDGTVVMDDEAITVTVSNTIWFPDPYQMAGYGLYVGAQTVCPNGAYEIDFYDDQWNPYGYYDGPIDANGFLSYPGNPGTGGFSFDITDGNGNPPSFPYFNIVYTVWPAGATPDYPQSSGPPWSLTNKVPIEQPWNSYTYGCMAYEDFFNPEDIGWSEQRDLMQAISPIENSFHNVSWCNNGNGLNALTSMVQWLNMTNDLNTYWDRDFYYLGHGSPTALGWNSEAKTSDVAWMLCNNPVNVYTRFNYHPYRFVFLDGCQTAEGDSPQAFGIPKQANMRISDFTVKRGIRPRAFMGWNRNKTFAIWHNASAFISHATYISTFWTSWGSAPGGGTNT